MTQILFPQDTTGVTPATGDIILIADVSDSNNPKDCTLAELPISTATQTALDAKQDTLTGLTASVAELNYTDGVTSAIQTQIDSKAPIASPTFTGTVSGITAAMVGAPSGSGSSTGTNTGDQTIANTSDATSHTATLSATGGSIKLVEGSGITLTTTGTSADGIVTIASTGGGSGDVVGPASATDNAIARYDTTTGKLIQNSGVTIGDTNIVSGVATLNTQQINATSQADFSYDFSDTIISGGGLTFYGATHRRINDGGSNELIKFPTSDVAGAVNEFTITNAATGTGPTISATGGDTNIDFNIVTKGSGVVKVNGSAIATGNVTKVGTPVNNQVGVWTGDGTLEGDTALTFDTTTDTLATTLITATTVTANLVGNVTGNASGTAATVTSGTQAAITSAANLATVGTITSGTWNATDIAVADGGTGRSTGTTAYSLIATGTTATGAQQTLANGATTEVLVGGGASALPVWTTATGSGSPVRATSPTLVTPLLGTPTSGTLTNCTGGATTAEINTGTANKPMPVDQYVASNRNVRYIDIYAIEKGTDNAVGTNIAGAFECPFTGTITEIGAYVETAGTTGASVWDVNKNGTTIMTTNKLSIDSGEVSTRTAATAPTLTTTAITAGDLITIDTDSLSTTKPKGFHLRLGIRLT